MNKDERGFSLVELLIAMMVIGIMAAGMTGLFTSIISVQNASRYRELATRAAQRQIEVLRNNNYAQLTPGSSIDFTSSLPTDLPSGRSGTTAVSEPITGLRRVDVTVSYPYGGETNTIKLSSMIGEIGLTE